MPGEVYCEQAYAQGKMLDHSSWAGELPRGITPSDIDAVFDDRKHGRILHVEFSSQVACWRDVNKGQRELYSGIVTQGYGRAMVALCKHSVPSERQIDTMRDVDSFQVMHFAALFGWATSPICEGQWWPDFVLKFYEGTHFKFHEWG